MKKVFELEFQRQAPIELFYVWALGHEYLHRKIFLNKNFLACRAFAYYQDGIVYVYTQKGNIDIIKKGLKKLAKDRLEKIIKDYYNGYLLLKAGKLTLDRDKIQELSSGFIVVFALGDLEGHILQKEAIKIREKTEDFFDLIKSLLNNKILNKYPVFENKEALINFFKKENITMAEKKILTREHSREYSLFRLEAWYLSMTKWLPFYIGRGIYEGCAFYSGKDLVNIYYEQDSLKKVFASIVALCQDVQKVNKQMDHFFELFNFLLPYFQHQKKPKDIDELKQLFEKYTEYWSYVAVLFVIPTFPNVDKKIRARSMEARKQTQEYNESLEPVFASFIENSFPLLKGKSRFILPEEVWSGLAKKPIIKKRIQKREKGYIFYRGRWHTGNLEKVLEKLGIELSDGGKTEGIKEFKGQVAFKGKVRGKVKIVSSTKDLTKVLDGDVLVAANTMPKYLPAMKKAAAFVTDEGGITCHAAIVSREMKKPCVVGTKIATKVLKDGMEVEVDAERGVVKIINN